MTDMDTTPLVSRALLLLLSVTIFLCAPVHGKTITQVQAELADEISRAQKQLQQTEDRISAQRKTLSQELNQLERQVEALRSQHAAATRARDERHLSLEKLRERLAQWQEQDNYQRHVIERYLASSGDSPTRSGRPLPELLSALDARLEASIKQLEPHWQARRVIGEHGDLMDAMTLTLGPVSWFLDSAQGTAGLLSTDSSKDPLAFAVPLARQDAAQLQKLFDTGQGEIAFDPTLDKVQALHGSTSNLGEHLRAGGLWILPILLAGLIALLIAAVKYHQLRRLPALNHSESGDTVASGTERELLAVARHLPPGQQRDDQLLNIVQQERRRLDTGLGALAIIAAISPLLGLLGTVSGMIETFQLMTLFGAGDPEAVSSGISKALITTEVGLVVAIPSILLHAVLSRRVKNHCATLEQRAIAISQMNLQEAGP